MRVSAERIDLEEDVSEGLSVLIIGMKGEVNSLEQMTKSMGHIPQVVYSYNAALEKIKESRFDLVILDMDLEEGSWFSTIVWIRELVGNIHMITMTEDNCRELEELAREQKIIYYIIKPLDIKEISSVVEHVAKKKYVRTKVKLY